MYQPKKGEMFYSTLTIFQTMYLYPTENQSKNWKLYVFKAVIVRVVTSFAYFECWLHLIMALIDSVPVNLSEDIEGITGLGDSVFVCCQFQYMSKNWSKFLNEVTDTKRFGKPTTYAKVVRRTNLCSMTYFICTSVCVILYGIIKVLDTDQCKMMNELNGTHEVCDSVTPLWWPTAEMNLWLKAFFTFCSLVSCEFYLPPSGIVSFLVWESVVLIQAKIAHLKELFRDCLNDEDPCRKREKLTNCIQYHLEIFRLCNELNNLSKWILGQLSFAAAVVIGCIVNQMIKQYAIGSTFHLLGYMLVVFLTCQTGQIMKDETCDIQDALYEAKWVGSNKDIIKDLKFIMLRCQAPTHLRAIPLGTFDYSLWIVILKSSYSYITLLTKQ
ncbi:uncharacterized protein LOC143203450 isoform X2 [Rhynchophorus ferrugineus]|uniref:uncharacterized protein LOC143203450 isoform X2 n=1 Tax=Rhynchophorus ferrugineus TaxID=354439 RepID=UPI003FCCA7E4